MENELFTENEKKNKFFIKNAHIEYEEQNPVT